MSSAFSSGSGAVSGVGPGVSGLCSRCVSPARSPLAPSPAWLAARAAAAAGVLAVIRLSSRSFSGSVGIVFFISAAAASAFARSLAGILGISLVVRGWSVSVPVFLGGEPC